MKHSKAPWVFDPSTKDIMSPEGEVCSLNFSEPGPNEAADVALIEAGPEMLEALEILVFHAPTKECEVYMRGIIKKAKGETK